MTKACRKLYKQRVEEGFSSFSGLGKQTASLRCREAKDPSSLRQWSSVASLTNATSTKGSGGGKAKKKDNQCSLSCKTLGETKTHRHPANRDEPYLMRARYLVHIGFYK